ncbi:MAG TPA: hypothetical protein VF807_01335, partial [Ktedonobacterales bacterium]
VIATGFFFITAMFVGQIPSYAYTVATLATLQSLEQGALALGLLSLGIGICCFAVTMLYDPKPLIPWPLFALGGLGLTVVGGGLLLAVGGLDPIAHGIFPQYLPTVDQGAFPTSWWLQPGSIDLVSVGLATLVSGLGLFAIAALNPFVLSGRLSGPGGALIVRVALTASLGLIALFVAILTFAPGVFQPESYQNGSRVLGPPSLLENGVLFVAMCLAVFALLVWLLPVMVKHRQEFMPGVYLHGVVVLISMVALPLLVIWAVAYPIVNWVQTVDTSKFWVVCSKKNALPASCTTTPFTGYLICGLVFGATFTALLVAIYFWSTRRNMIVIGGTISLIWLGLAGSVVHTRYTPELSTQIPMGLLIAACVAVLAYLFTWATQREFAPTIQSLGCVGQWLVLGTLWIILLFGFAVFSMPKFFEMEAGLTFFYDPGHRTLHDAIWVLLVMGALGGVQFWVLKSGRKMGDLRKFVLWTLAIAAILMLVAMIQGFNYDFFFQGGLQTIEAAHVLFFFGLLLEVIGLVVAFYGAWRARATRWSLIMGLTILAGIAFAAIIYSLSFAPQPIIYSELVALGIFVTMTGALAFSAAGPDGREEPALANGNGAAHA